MTRLVVIGGGPVGLATSLYAREAGFQVTVYEPRRLPVDKACGEGLLPGAVAALDRLGVQPAGVPFRGIRYLDARSAASALFPGRPGIGVRRTALSAALAAQAVETGVELVGDVARRIEQVDGGVSVDGIRADWLIGADGLHSRTRVAAGNPADRPKQGHSSGRRFGLRQHYRIAPWTDLVEVYWSAVGEAYVTPVDSDLVGVAILTAQRAGFDELLGAFPRLSDRLAGAAPDGPVLGAGPLRQRVGRRRNGRVLLVGDAAGYVDALTGEGIAVGMRTARAAVACIAAGRPQNYERAWRRETRGYRLLTRTLVEATRVPLVRGRVVGVAARAPWLFDHAVHALAG